MHPRLLRHARRHTGPLAHPKSAHQFAASHALSIYGARAIYTFIPKNGCSTMRLSLGIANGALTGPEDIDWIHSKQPDLRRLARRAGHRRLHLRDPPRSVPAAGELLPRQVRRQGSGRLGVSAARRPADAARRADLRQIRRHPLHAADGAVEQVVRTFADDLAIYPERTGLTPLFG